MADPGLKPRLEHFKSRIFVEPHLDRTQWFLDTNTDSFSRANAQRLDAEHTKWTTLNTKPEICVLELTYPGTGYTKLIDKWFYVYHAGKGQMLLEVYAHQRVTDQPRLDRPDVMEEVYELHYKQYPPPPPAGQIYYGGLPAASEGFELFSLGSPETTPVSAMRVPLPKGSVTQADVDSRSIRIFVSPWRFTAECHALATAQSTADPKGAWATVRNGGGGMIWGVAVDPFAWAFECKTRLFEPRLDQWDHYVKDEDRQAELFIATTLKSWIADGDRYGVENEVVMSELNRWLNDYRAKELALRTLVEEAASYLAATCLDGPEHRLAEKAAMDGGEDGATLAGMQWMTTLTTLQQCLPGRNYCLDLIADPSRYVRRQIFPDAAPLVSWDNYGTIRWLLYANWLSFGELVTTWRIWKASSGFLQLAEEQRLFQYAQALGMHFETSTVSSVYKLDPGGFGEAYPRLKQLSGNLVKDGDALIVADAEGVLKLPPHSGRWKSLKWIESPSLAAKRSWVSGFHSSAKLVLDIMNLGISLQNCRKAEGTMAKVDTVIAAIGASTDLGQIMLELSVTYMKKKGEKSLVYWGPVVRNARALGGALGVVSGVCDAYDMYRKGQGSWDRDATGEWVGAALGVAGGMASALGGALAMAAWFFPTALAATGWAGPLGVALSIIGSALLIAGAVLIFWLKQYPHEQFALYSMFGRGRLKEKTAFGSKHYPWMPNRMPCATRRAEIENLGALFANYIVRIRGSDNERRNLGNQLPAYLEIMPGMLDHTARLSVRIDQSYHGGSYAAHNGSFWCRLLVDEISDAVTWESGGTMELPWVATKRHPNHSVEMWQIPLRPKWLGDQRIPFDADGVAVMDMGEIRITVTSSDAQTPPFNKTFKDDMASTGFTTFDADKMIGQ